MSATPSTNAGRLLRVLDGEEEDDAANEGERPSFGPSLPRARSLMPVPALSKRTRRKRSDDSKENEILKGEDSIGDGLDAESLEQAARRSTQYKWDLGMGYSSNHNNDAVSFQMKPRELNESYVCGDVCFGNFQDLLLAQMYYNTDITGIVHAFLSGRLCDDRVQPGRRVTDNRANAPTSAQRQMKWPAAKGSIMTQVYPPAEFFAGGRDQFGELLAWLLLEYDVMVIGIFCVLGDVQDMRKDTQEEEKADVHKGNSAEPRYALVSPIAERTILPNDLLCVLVHSRRTYERLSAYQGPTNPPSPSESPR